MMTVMMSWQGVVGEFLLSLMDVPISGHRCALYTDTDLDTNTDMQNCMKYWHHMTNKASFDQLIKEYEH